MVMISIAYPISAAQVGGRGGDADSPASIKKEILRMEDTRDRALLRRDTATLDHLFADDMAWTSPNGEVLTKSQILSNLKTGKETFPSIVHNNVQLHIYQNTAVVFGITTSRVFYNGSFRNKPRRFTNVWVRRDGEWKLVDHQVTLIGH